MYKNLIGEYVSVLTDQKEEHETEDGQYSSVGISYCGFLIDFDDLAIAIGSMEDSGPLIQMVVERKNVIAIHLTPVPTPGEPADDRTVN